MPLEILTTTRDQAKEKVRDFLSRDLESPRDQADSFET